MQENQVLGMLQNEIELLEKLNELSLLKKEALLNDDVNLLETIVIQEEASFRQLKNLDDACASQVQFFLQAQQADTTISEVIQDKNSQLRQLAGKLQNNNQFNLDLTRDALAITQFMLNTFTAPAGNKVSTYNASGKMVDRKAKNHLLDYKG